MKALPVTIYSLPKSTRHQGSTSLFVCVHDLSDQWNLKFPSTARLANPLCAVLD